MGRFNIKDDRAATDPVLIIAGIAITLILLVGGSFAVAGFMNNARDLNAKGDLDRVATAQTAAMASTDTYQASASGPGILASKKNAALSSGNIGFTPSDDVNVVVEVGQEGWAALAESASGALFLRTSESNAIIQVDASTIREDFLITALEGRLVDAGASATSTDDKVVKFPADVSVYNLSWAWVDAFDGLSEDTRPEPGAALPGAGGPGPTQPEPSIPPMPDEAPLKMGNPFSSTTLDYVELTTDSLSNPSASYACVYFKYSGEGKNWSVKLDPDHVLFKNDLDLSHYRVNSRNTIRLEGDHFIIEPKPTSPALVKGVEGMTNVCNENVPIVLTKQVDSTFQTIDHNGSWEKKITVSTTSPYRLSWKIRVDMTDIVEKYGMEPNALRFVRPGLAETSTMTWNHVGGNIYEFQAWGASLDVNNKKPINFAIFPAFE